MRRAPSPTASVMSDAISPLPGHSSSAEKPAPTGPAAGGKPPVAARTPSQARGNTNPRGTEQRFEFSTLPGRSQHRFKLSLVGGPVGPRRLLIEPCHQRRALGGRQEGTGYRDVLSSESNFGLFRLLGRCLGGLFLYDLRRDKRRPFSPSPISRRKWPMRSRQRILSPVRQTGITETLEGAARQRPR